MLRLFFHTQTDTRSSDDEGTELSGAVGAWEKAIWICGQMTQDCSDGLWGSRPCSVTVTDAAGLILWDIFVDGVAGPQPFDQPANGRTPHD